MRPRERETEDISTPKKWAIGLFLFCGFFGIITITSTSSPVGMYLGLLFLFIALISVLMLGMWSVAGKADEFVGKYTK